MPWSCTYQRFDRTLATHPYDYARRMNPWHGRSRMLQCLGSLAGEAPDRTRQHAGLPFGVKRIGTGERRSYSALPVPGVLWTL